MLPKIIDNIKVPPLKIQGIKTKLVPWIASNISWDGNGCYFEPFMGSGVVGFNLQPQKAIFSDINPHIIQFYKDIQNKKLTPAIVKEYLEQEGERLADSPNNKESYYYCVRNRFNQSPNSLDFLFLQRTNFNGLMRFNSKGEYNVPFGKNPNKLKKGLITKIVNQIDWVSSLICDKDWQFVNMSFDGAFEMATPDDFFYLEPPYIGLNDDYFEAWSEDKANLLLDLVQKKNIQFALSMWKNNGKRDNEYLNKWCNNKIITTEHFYHVGSKVDYRKGVIEALVKS